mmetsp:Transcript_106873/g.189931  ORF Transcript_106873/g.189931 Transcript_106873/m.189931 type:complete len:491 (-) Transcript_106873:318-1790(-)
MRIGVITHGTRGDTQPFIALAQRLKANGHELAICCPASDVHLVREHGLEAHGLTFDAKKLVKGEKMQEAMDSCDGNKCVEAAMESAADQKAEGADSPEEASAFIFAYKPDIILANASFQAYCVIAERLQLPLVLLMFMPFLPSRVAFPAFKTEAQLKADGMENNVLAAHRQLFDAFLGPKDLLELNKLRDRWGLNAYSTVAELHGLVQAIPTANCWSQAVFPEPPDMATEFPFSRQTGYLFADPPTGYVPEEKLQKFLEDGERPLYIGFGSLSAGDPRSVTEKVMRALMLAGNKRCVMAGGWSGIGPEHLDVHLTEDYTTLKQFADNHVVKVDAVPHSWLLPLCSAAVHHGGAGTTAAVVRAGVPSAIAPFAWDQPWWAERMEKLGVGFGLSGMITKIDAEELGRAIQRLTEDDQMMQQAAFLGSRVRGENGAEQLEAFIKTSLSLPFPWPTPVQPIACDVPAALWDRPVHKGSLESGDVLDTLATAGGS